MVESVEYQDMRKVGECCYCEDPIYGFQDVIITAKRKRKVHAGCFRIFVEACQEYVTRRRGIKN